MQINKHHRWIILLEIVIPVVLFLFGSYNGLMQTLYRAGIIQSTSFLGINYYQGLTMHGVINAIVLTTFFAVAFGNAVVIYYLNKTINIFWNWVSFLLMMVGTLLAAWTMFAGEASVLYTFYPPLKAHPFFYIGTTTLVVGSWVAFFNWIRPYLQWRKENKEKKTPLAVVGMFATFIVWFIATLPVAYELIFMLIPWSMGIYENINIMLSRVLFWFFGHPLVYFWLLPVYVMYYVMLPKSAGGKLYSDFAGRLVFMLFIIFSIPVGLHHQFAEPSISQNMKLLQAVFTFGVAVPSLLTAFTISASMEYAGVNNGGKGLFGWLTKLPYFNKDSYIFAYSVTGLIIFIFGGITGMVNASYSMNMVVHNTAWLPGHFHMTVAGPVLLGILALSLHLVTKLTGKPIKWPGWNVAVPYMWLLGLFLFSGGLMLGGLVGEPRRTNMGMTYLNPDSDLYRPDWVFTTHTTVIGGVIMFLTIIVYFFVFFGTLFNKKTEEAKVDFPTSEAYHDEKNINIVKNFTPWIIVALIIILIAYIPTIQEALENGKVGSPPYSPDSPVPLEIGKDK